MHPTVNTMKLGGRFTAILPFALVLFALLGVYLYYRNKLNMSDYIHIHSNTEEEQPAVNIAETKREHVQKQSAKYSSKDYSGFKYENIKGRAGSVQHNRGQQSNKQLSDGAQTTIDTTSTTFMDKMVSLDTTSANRDTTAGFVNETTTPALTMATHLHNKDADVGRQSLTDVVKVNISNRLDCERLLVDVAKQNMNDTIISNLAQTCLTATTPLSVGPGLFKSLFTNDVFQTLQCGEPETGPNDGPPLPVIALASFPGSGNTWARVLLDQLTGIYTGSIGTCGMSNSILKGSLLCPFSKVFIIKTHKKGGAAGRCGVSYLDFESAIYILRNPYNAMIAEYNRRNAGKVNTVTREMFQDEKWERRVNEWTEDWTNHVRYWLSTFDHPVHILVYEDLVANTLWELYKLSKFLNRSVTFETLWCIQYRQSLNASFKREKPDWLQAKYLFSEKFKNKMNRRIKSLIPGVATKHGLKNLFKSYML